MVYFLDKEKYYSKSAIFNVEFELKSEKFKLNYFDPLFVILNKYYPGYFFQKKDDEDRLIRSYWEDILLYNDRRNFYSWGTDSFELLTDAFIPLNVSCSNDSISSKFLEGGLSIFIKSDLLNNSCVILSFHSTLLLKSISYWRHHEKKVESQEESSNQNRRNLEKLIREIESYFNWNIVNSWSDIEELDKKYIFRYGLKEDASLSDLPS